MKGVKENQLCATAPDNSYEILLKNSLSVGLQETINYEWNYWPLPYMIN